MQQENDEQYLRHLFHDLQEQDRRAAPPFRRVWRQVLAAHERDRSSRRPPWLTMASGATAVAAVLVAWFYLGPLSPQTPMAYRAVAISDWQSPTAFLLDHTGRDLYGNLSGPGVTAELADYHSWVWKL